MINTLWLQRKKKFIRSFIASTKYILNDSFISIIFILFILFSYYFPTIVEELLNIDIFWLKILIFFLSYAVFTSQRVFLFIENADLFFLLTKENMVVKQLKKAAKQSVLFTCLFQSIYYCLIFFLLLVIDQQPLLYLFKLFIIINLLLLFKLATIFLHFYDQKESFFSVIQLCFPPFVLLLTVFEKNFIVTLLLLAYFFICYVKTKQSKKNYLNWAAVLLYEQTSLIKLNRFFSHFLSIKTFNFELSSPDYINKVFNVISRTNDYLLVYLYFRKLLRIKENRRELLLVPSIITVISISLSPSLLSILIPSIIFITTTITLSEKYLIHSYHMLTITKKHINRFLFSLVLLQCCLFAPIFVYLLFTQHAYLYIIGTISITILFLNYTIKDKNILNTNK